MSLNFALDAVNVSLVNLEEAKIRNLVDHKECLCVSVNLRALRKLGNESVRMSRCDARLAKVTDTLEGGTETVDMRCKRGSRLVVRLLESPMVP